MSPWMIWIGEHEILFLLLCLSLGLLATMIICYVYLTKYADKEEE